MYKRDSPVFNSLHNLKQTESNLQQNYPNKYQVEFQYYR